MKLLQIIITLLIANTIRAQDSTNQNKRLKWSMIREERIFLLKSDLPNNELAFSNIVVIDNRPDPKNLCYISTGIDSRGLRYTSIGSDPQNEISKLLKKQFAYKSDGQTLTIVLNNFWISKDLQSLPVIKTELDFYKSINNIIKYDVIIEADYYTKINDTLYNYITTTDGIYRYNWRGGYDKRNKMLTDALSKSILNANYQYKNTDVTKPILTKTYTQINVNHTLIVPKRGIYINIAEFKNNNPRYIEFKPLFGKYNDEIVVLNTTTNKEDTITSKVFALSDGDNAYINFKNNFFKIETYNNAWKAYVGSVTEFTLYNNNMPVTSTITNTLLYGVGTAAFDLAFSSILKNSSKRMMYYFPMQINATTGKLMGYNEGMYVIEECNK